MLEANNIGYWILGVLLGIVLTLVNSQKTGPLCLSGRWATVQWNGWRVRENDQIWWLRRSVPRLCYLVCRNHCLPRMLLRLLWHPQTTAARRESWTIHLICTWIRYLISIILCAVQPISAEYGCFQFKWPLIKPVTVALMLHRIKWTVKSIEKRCRYMVISDANSRHFYLITLLTDIVRRPWCVSAHTSRRLNLDFLDR